MPTMPLPPTDVAMGASPPAVATASASGGSSWRLPCPLNLARCPVRRALGGSSLPPPPTGVAEEAGVGASGGSVGSQARATPEPEEDKICRFCFEGEGGEAGELISPCRCAGGQKYVHLSCLRWWQRTVLVAQPTHPNLYDMDTRQRICNVCKSEFTCPPPSRSELLASVTGPELTALIDEGVMVASSRNFSQELESQLAVFPESLLGNIVCRHWIKGVFLIVNVKEDRDAGREWLLKLESEEDLSRFVAHLESDGRSFRLRGRRFLMLAEGALREVPAESSAEVRRAALRALETPCTLRLRPEETHDCGEDGILAVNMTRPLEGNALGEERKAVFRASLLEDFGGFDFGEVQASLMAKVSHFIGGPCEPQRIGACLVLRPGPGQEHLVFCGTDALRKAARAADAVASGEAPFLAAEPAGEASEEVAAPMPFFFEADLPPPKRRRIDPQGEGSGAVAAGLDLGEGPGVQLMVFWGYAGWSRCQLMGEIARGSWGLCRTSSDDFAAFGGGRPGSSTEGSASSSSSAPPPAASASSSASSSGPLPTVALAAVLPGSGAAGSEPSAAHLADFWARVYPRLVFAPKNELSESYGGQEPEVERRRRELRRMAIYHELLRRHIGGPRGRAGVASAIATAAANRRPAGGGASSAGAGSVDAMAAAVADAVATMDLEEEAEAEAELAGAEEAYDEATTSCSEDNEADGTEGEIRGDDDSSSDSSSSSSSSDGDGGGGDDAAAAAAAADVALGEFTTAAAAAEVAAAEEADVAAAAAADIAAGPASFDFQ